MLLLGLGASLGGSHQFSVAEFEGFEKWGEDKVINLNDVGSRA